MKSRRPRRSCATCGPSLMLRRHNNCSVARNRAPRRQQLQAPARPRSRSCIIDGEAVACDDKGVASFDLIRHHRADDSIFLYSFDLIELNGDDLRRDPLEVRKATLASIVAKARPGHPLQRAYRGRQPDRFRPCL
jgi:bifunctional non-homologous end joining protein LigD